MKKYIPYIFAIVATVLVVLLFISNNDLKFRSDVLNQEKQAISHMLDIKEVEHEKLNDKLAVIDDSLSTVNEKLDSVVNREQDLIISYERRLIEVTEMSNEQIDTFLIENYPDNRDIVRDLVAFSHCKEMLVNKDGEIKLLETKIDFKDDIILAQDSIILNLNAQVLLTQDLVANVEQQAALNKKHMKRMRRQRNFAIIGGVGLATAAIIFSN